VFARKPTERELRIDLRPGAVNPTAPTRPCGAVITDDADELRHMASAHPGYLSLLETLAEIGIEVALGRQMATKARNDAAVESHGLKRRR